VPHSADILGLSATAPRSPWGGTGPSTAIVLGGGGAKGSFEVGALAFLVKRAQEIKVDVICGSSVGAVNGLTLSAHGLNGAATLIEIYLGLRSPRSMYIYDWRIENADQVLSAEFGKHLS